MGDDRRPTYIEVGDDGEARRIWRASSLGACDRSLVMHALGHDAAPVPEAIQRAYDAGHQNEDAILARAQDEGWRMLDNAEVWQQHGRVDESGQLCVELDCGKVGGVRQVIRCHPDGIALKYKRHVNGRAGVESEEDWLGAKRVAEAKFLRRGSPHTSVAKARSSRFYSWQTSVEMHATGLGLLMLVGWKEKQEDGTEKLGDVEIACFDQPMYKLGEVKRRVIQLARLIGVAEEEGLGAIECDWAMYPCAFWETHDGQKVWVKGGGKQGAGLELGQDGAVKLTALAGRVTKARMMEERYKAQKQDAMEELRVALAQYSGERGNTYRVGDFTIQWKYTPAKEAEERVVKYKAREESETVIVKQGKVGEKGGEG